MSKYLTWCQEPSFDGRWWARYPAGNAPEAVLFGAALARSHAGGVPTTHLPLGAVSHAVKRSLGEPTTQIALIGKARDISAARATQSTPGQTFNFYVSPTGSDSNPGTLTQPWAITSLMLISRNSNNVSNCNKTSGQRIGFLPGTYYLTTKFTGTIANGSKSMTVSGVTSVITPGMHLVSGLGSAFTAGQYGWGPMVTAVSGNTITLDTAASAALTSATIVATFMAADVIGATQLIGSTNAASPTYWASSDSNGYESPRTATLDAEGGSGVYGGFIATSPSNESLGIITHIGKYPSPGYTLGNATISGLRLTGYSYTAIQIGAWSYEDSPAQQISGITVKDNEIFGGNCSGNNLDNAQCIWIDTTVGANIVNNWLHDNIGPRGSGNADHLNGILVFGSYASGTLTNSGILIEKNTVVNTGAIYGKEKYIQGSTIRYNYLDTSNLTNAGGLQDWMGGNSSTTLSGTTYFHNNIVIFDDTNSEGGLIGAPTSGNNFGWTTPIEAYNNTFVVKSGGVPTAAWLTGVNGAAGAIKFYNNIYVNQSASGSDNLGFGVVSTNPSAPAVWDYNLYYSPSVTLHWRLWTNASIIASGTAGNPTAVSGSPYSSAAAFASALSGGGGIAGAETHSVVGTSPTFTNTGTYAMQYQLDGGSAGVGQGSTDGTTAGSPCDMGAWGGSNPPAQIGCDFATT